MSQASRQRTEIEGVIRAWFADMTPEDRAAEGSKMVGFLAAKLAFFCDRRSVAELLWTLGDQVVMGAAPSGDPT